MRPMRFLYLVIALIAVGMAINSVLVWVALSQVSDQGNRIEREGMERRDQSCRMLEKQYNERIQGLRTTYAYFDGLTLKQAREPLNRTLFGELTGAEQEARQDRPPAFCLEPGIGLPGKPQQIPARPAHVTELLTELGLK